MSQISRTVSACATCGAPTRNVSFAQAIHAHLPLQHSPTSVIHLQFLEAVAIPQIMILLAVLTLLGWRGATIATVTCTYWPPFAR